MLICDCKWQRLAAVSPRDGSEAIHNMDTDAALGRVPHPGFP